MTIGQPTGPVSAERSRVRPVREEPASRRTQHEAQPPTRPRTTGGRTGDRSTRRRWVVVVMIAPMGLTLLAFTVYPLLAVLWYGLHHTDLTRPDKTGFAGLTNFTEALSDPALASAVVLTVVIVVTAVVVEFVLGTAAAALLWRPLLGDRVYLPLLTLPFAATPIAAYLAWRLMLNPAGGQVNAVLGTLGLPTPGWTSSPPVAVVSIIGVDIWQWTPFVTLVMLAGLRALPNEPFEAAALDGAARIRQLWQVALPMLRPLAAFVITFRTIDAVRTFDSIWMITGGGPGSATETLTVHIYREAFSHLKIGEAAALGLLLLVVLIVLGRLFAAPALRRLET